MEQVNLYRALAHAPRLLEAWLDFACVGAARALRDAPLAARADHPAHRPTRLLARYEWHHHRRMAAEVGVDECKVAELAVWRVSPAFSDAERATLTLTDALFDRHVPDEVNAALAEHFGPRARVELALTVAFYCAVPRLLDALRVPVETAPGPTAPNGEDRPGPR